MRQDGWNEARELQGRERHPHKQRIWQCVCLYGSSRKEQKDKVMWKRKVEKNPWYKIYEGQNKIVILVNHLLSNFSHFFFLNLFLFSYFICLLLFYFLNIFFKSFWFLRTVANLGFAFYFFSPRIFFFLLQTVGKTISGLLAVQTLQNFSQFFSFYFHYLTCVIGQSLEFQKNKNEFFNLQLFNRTCSFFIFFSFGCIYIFERKGFHEDAEVKKTIVKKSDAARSSLRVTL